MAEESGQERTEEPTAKRLEEARRKGQVPRSRELNTLMVLLAGALLFVALGERMADSLWHLMHSQLQIGRADMFDPKALTEHFQRVFLDGFKIIAPFLALMTVAALLAPIALGGFAFNAEAWQPKLERLDPLQGLKRIFALRGLIELVKSLLKFFLIAAVVVVLGRIYRDELIGLAQEPLIAAIQHGVKLIALCFLILSASLLLVAAIDVPYQLWDHKRKLRMTRQQIKDEMKESEGRPEVKSRIRSLQMEMAQRRMMEEVPKADVILTNPTHFAVALKYDQSATGAPRVVAKGTDFMAAQIRHLAMNAQVPLVAAPPLARALYYSTELDAEIPQGLYLAVAQVLAYIYQLQAADQYGYERPLPPAHLPVPEEYRRYTGMDGVIATDA